MIRTLENASGTADATGDGTNVVIREADFDRTAVWMQTDANYLTSRVLPAHDKLMADRKRFGDGTHKVTAKDQCAPVESTDALMGRQSTAMYRCVERGLLHVLPALNTQALPSADATPTPS